MRDRVFESFLIRQHEEGMALACDSDFLDLVAAGEPPNRYVARFGCRGLVSRLPHTIVEFDHFEVGIRFSPDYLRLADPFRVLTWLGPREIWHPNIAADAPVICVGRLAPGTGLVDILYQVFEIITWKKVTMREDDALNKEACSWARRNQHRFPVDPRPLKRRLRDFSVEERASPGEINGQQR
jgi:hypothetical protein